MSSVFLLELHSNQCCWLGRINQLVKACLDESFKVINVTFKYFHLPKVIFYKDSRLNLVVDCIKFM